MNASMARQALRAVDASEGAAAPRRSRARRREAQAPQQPVEIVEAVADAGRVRVAQEIVAAVDVELPADRLREVRQLVPTVDQLDDARRERGVDDASTAFTPVDGSSTMRSVHVSCGGAPGMASSNRCDSGPCPRSCSSAAAMRLARAIRRDPLRVGQHSVDRPQASEEQLHHERGAERVREPRVLGARETRATSPRAGARAAGAAPPACRGAARRCPPRLPRTRPDRGRDPAGSRGPPPCRRRPSSCQTRTARGPAPRSTIASRAAGADPGARARARSARPYETGARGHAPRRSPRRADRAGRRARRDGALRRALDAHLRRRILRCRRRRGGPHALDHEATPSRAAGAPARCPRASGEASPTHEAPPERVRALARGSAAAEDVDDEPALRATRTRSTRSSRARGFCVGNPVRSPARACRSGGTSVQSASTRRSRQCVPSASFTRKYFTYTRPLAVRCTRPSLSRRAIDSSV